MDLTDAYENGAYIPDALAIRDGWVRDAAAFRATARSELDVSYGDAPREKLDLFWPEGTPKGLMVFIHGGYWRMLSKEEFSHCAAGAVARGWAVAMPSYTLCPEIRIAEITRQTSRAVSHVATRVEGPIVITRHSAGGHLSARMAMPGVLEEDVAARVTNVMPISPLSDLRPLMQTDMNADLRIDSAEAETESPILGPRRDFPVHVWVGGAERPAFLDQARWLQEAWNCGLTITEGEHHFNVIAPLANAKSALCSTLQVDPMGN